MIVLGCMDLDLTLWEERLASLNDNSTANEKASMEKWNRSNRMCLIIMKCFISEIFRDSMSEEKNAKKFFNEIKQRFTKKEKVEITILLANLVSMKYKGK